MSEATYRLVVDGELDRRFAYLFDGILMTHVGGQTVLTGPVIDQAQLHRFLERIDQLGLKLVLVRQERPGEHRAQEGGSD
jgi:hypothetical protein